MYSPAVTAGSLDNLAARQQFLLAENPRPPRHKGSGQLHGPGVYRRIVRPSLLESGSPAKSRGSAAYFKSADEDHQAMHLTVQITPYPARQLLGSVDCRSQSCYLDPTVPTTATASASAAGRSSLLGSRRAEAGRRLAWPTHTHTHRTHRSEGVHTISSRATYVSVQRRGVYY